MSSFDASLVADDLKKVIKRNPQILSKVFVIGLDSMYKYIGKQTKIADKWELGGLNMTDVVQPGNRRTVGDRSFNPVGAARPELHIGQLMPAKVDLLFTEQELKVMTKIFLQNLDQAFVKTIPGADRILMALADKIRQNLRLKTLFRGVYNGATTTPESVMNGWLKLVLDGLTGAAPLLIPAGNVFAGTTPSDANIIAQVEGPYNLIPDERKLEPMVSVMSVSNARRYSRALKTLWGNTITEATLFAGIDTIPETNVKIIAEPGFGTSNKILYTYAGNLEIGFKNEGDLDSIQMQAQDRDLQVMIDFEIGVDIHNYDLIWCNDLA